MALEDSFTEKQILKLCTQTSASAHGTQIYLKYSSRYKRFTVHKYKMCQNLMTVPDSTVT